MSAMHPPAIVDVPSRPVLQHWGLGVLVAVLLLGLGSAWLGQDPAIQNLDQTLSAPSGAHWLGTDHLGRDLLACLGEAVRVSFWLALGSALLAVALGSLLGLWAAWQRGWADRMLRLWADGVAAIPGLLWVLLVAALAPGHKWALYSGLVLTAWVEFFRLVRSRASLTLAGDAVQAGRLLGFGAPYLLRWYVLPPLLADLLRLWSYAVANAVLAVAALGFVGVGLRPPTAELGLMMTEALPYYDEAPWLLAGPVLLLVLVVAALQSATGAPQKDPA
ncbi:ABC transporter permease [Rhodoferax sp.]|uniref:ABC transporter permease n=1 Tax=Rhodoferax sp. TaxID=50421 RepID=UPI002ACEA4B1|nr:ABC transporter permease subunit [Rhodoferax sp.]MDZ7920005.1 ABC transporter permease subunit [Rhodoferax sp.]